jgi:hypothetical protein
MKQHYTFAEELALVGLSGAKDEGKSTADVGKVTGLQKSEVLDALEALAAQGLLEKRAGKRSTFWRHLPPAQPEIAELLPGINFRSRTWRASAFRLVVAKHKLGVPAKTAAAVTSEEGLATYFLAQRLGQEFRAGLTPTALGLRVAAEALGVSSPKPEELWKGLARLAGATAAPGENFAEGVKRAALQAGDGWFGDHKYFIHKAWKNYADASLDLPQFKERLLAAMRAGEIELSRADLNLGMDPADLESALIVDRGQEFHFINLPQHH